MVTYFIFLTENFYLYNIWYEQFTDKDYLQLSLLILFAKDRALKLSKDDCLIRRNFYNYFSQSLLVAEFTSKLLDNTSLNNKLIISFSKYLIDNKDSNVFSM